MIGKSLMASALAMVLVCPAGAVAQTQRSAPAEQVQAAPAEKLEFIARQNSNEHFASNMIGAQVENPQGETLGTINNLVIGPEGEVSTAVIGVGGFLGIGEKNIALPYDRLQTRMENGSLVAMLNATKAELETAPDYRDAEGQPLSLSKRLTDTARETYNAAKDRASETYDKAKESVGGSETPATRTQ